MWVCVHLGVCLRVRAYRRVWACVPRHPSFVINERCFCASWYRVCGLVCAQIVCMWICNVCVGVCMRASACKRGHSPVTCSGCVMNEEERCLQSQRDLGETLFYGVKNGLVLCQRLRECWKKDWNLSGCSLYPIFYIKLGKLINY